MAEQGGGPEFFVVRPRQPTSTCLTLQRKLAQKSETSSGVGLDAMGTAKKATEDRDPWPKKSR